MKNFYSASEIKENYEKLRILLEKRLEKKFSDNDYYNPIIMDGEWVDIANKNLMFTVFFPDLEYEGMGESECDMVFKLKGTMKVFGIRLSILTKKNMKTKRKIDYVVEFFPDTFHTIDWLKNY